MKMKLILNLLMAITLLSCTSGVQKENQINDKLLPLWKSFTSFAFETYMKEGIEAPIFNKIGVHSEFAESFSRYSSHSQNYLDRKLAASLAGYISNPNQNLLSDILKLETDRDKSLPANDFERLDCQSVVEDIVFSAARWCKYNRNKQQALDVLRKVIQDSIDGQYWNTSSYAMVYLCMYAPMESKVLLTNFDKYSKGEIPKHPSNPSLVQERNHAQRLLNNDRNLFESYDRFLKNPEGVEEKPELTPEQNRIVNKLLSTIEK
jgi:hypothetical protein